MRVLVTGATGFIGRPLVAALQARGDAVRALVRAPGAALPPGVEGVEGDVRDAVAIAAAVEGVDAVVHLAASIAVAGRHDPEMDAINVEGPARVAAACRLAGLPLVHTSSVHALCGFPDEAPVTERSALATEGDRGAYDRSKARGQQAAEAEAARGLDLRVVHPVGVMGPGDLEPSPVGAMLLQLARGELPGLVRGGFWWVDVRDVVAGTLAALDRGAPGARYLLSSAHVTLPALAGMVHAEGGARPPRLVSPLWLAGATAPLAVAWARLAGRRALYSPDSVAVLRCHQRLDDTWTRAALDFRPRPVQDSVRDALADFRARGLLPP